MERVTIFIHGYICLLATYIPPQCTGNLNMSVAFDRGLIYYFNFSKKA